MAISSPLNPEVISPQRKSKPEKFQNFISGGSPLGSSIFNAAANNIVGFTRGAGVAPRTPDLGSIINTLSTNILTNVENRIQSINQTVNQIVGDRVQEIQERYATKTKKLDTASPNKLLNAFLGLYDRAIEYLKFLGNPKNAKELNKNFDILRGVFEETFNVATIIRKQIVKIVNQLSTLPTASSSGGPGLNLDVKVPGGGLKKSAPRGLMRMMRRRPGLMLGGAALAGAGTMAATSALAGPGFVRPEEQSSDMGLGVSGNVLERFNIILDRFSQAIKSLTEAKEPEVSSGTSQTPTLPPEESTESGESGGVSGSTMGTGAQGVAGSSTRSLLDAIAYAEGTSKYPNQGYNTLFGGGQVQDLSKHPDKVVRGDRVSSAAFGRYQFMPATWQEVMGGAMTPERQDIAAVRLIIRRLNQAGIPIKNENQLEIFLQKEGLSQRVTSALAPEWASFPTVSGASAYPNQSVKKIQDIQKVYTERLQTQGVRAPSQTAQTTVVEPPPAMVSPTATQAQTQKIIAEKVAQPPMMQQSSEVNVMPINLAQGGNGQQVIGGEDGSATSSNIPFIMSTNEDNFLTLYSKMVYNIVDG